MVNMEEIMQYLLKSGLSQKEAERILSDYRDHIVDLFLDSMLLKGRPSPIGIDRPVVIWL